MDSVQSPLQPPEGPGAAAAAASSSASRRGWLHALPPIVAQALRLVVARRPAALPFSEFLKHAQEGRLAEVLMGHDRFEVRMKPPAAGGATAETYTTRVVPYMDRQKIIEMLDSKDVRFGTLMPSWGRRFVALLLGLAPFLYLALVYRMLRKLYDPSSDSVGKEHRAGQGGGRKRRVTFKDVAGVDQAKIELAEVVNFLRDRSRFVEIGARLPKGILLSGPPGTGKTLLARAVANEACVPFISCSASDFVEMLVGRGAARVRDLFQRGMAAAPCIIFIDELDALAKTRGAFSSNDEREQTLNQLLTEMDGFDASENSVLVIAATNRPEILDPALIRPGRFDRHVVVALPDTRGRRAILAVHARTVRLAGDVDLHRLAVRTRGYSGAELANVANEAALLAVRAGAVSVSQTFFEAAIERNNQARTLSALGTGSLVAAALHQMGSPGSGGSSNNNNNSENHPYRTP